MFRLESHGKRHKFAMQDTEALTLSLSCVTP